ncbi:MAG: dTMP kinase [SAR202 cluster bacterium]|nr:dTMP kinase [SAR202 cluster bacterium]MDP6513299.1 dTMP kinase [SAR202 cluster bacterium]MDP6715341.1 dTMP kinase [SAR202 cluster bacterium]
MSLFVSFEGGEGSGKTTQTDLLRQQLERVNVQYLFIHEPGHTNLGEHIRTLLKGNRFGKETISKGAELFLFVAARAELVSKVLKPSLKNKGAIIIADRFADSTIAYQGYGRKLPLDLVGSMNALATDDITPDMTFLLDCPPEVGLRRLGVTQIELGVQESEHVGRLDEEDSRKFEELPLAFHERVRQGYHELAQQEPGRWCIVDATKSEDDIHRKIWKRFRNLLETNGVDLAGNLTADDLLRPLDTPN